MFNFLLTCVPPHFPKSCTLPKSVPSRLTPQPGQRRRRCRLRALSSRGFGPPPQSHPSARGSHRQAPIGAVRSPARIGWARERSARRWARERSAHRYARGSPLVRRLSPLSPLLFPSREHPEQEVRALDRRRRRSHSSPVCTPPQAGTTGVPVDMKPDPGAAHNTIRHTDGEGASRGRYGVARGISPTRRGTRRHRARRPGAGPPRRVPTRAGTGLPDPTAPLARTRATSGCAGAHRRPRRGC
ncbi:hypothetical protein QE428_001356 [Microbacterium sp. SORGH_AS 505]|nr:hypothetical protein [Microbacterium sp. SORGH_AS_0505]